MTTSAQSDSSTIFRRLLELKQQYEEQKRALNPQQGLHGKHGRSMLDNASEEEKINPSEDNDDGNLSGDQPRTKRRKNAPLKIADQSNHSSNNDPTSVGQLQVTIRNILENHGGSCHLETIVENVKMRWQREGLIKPEGTPYGHADCKKSVLSNFRTRVNNKFIFAKDRVNEGCWTLVSADDDIKAQESKGKYLFQAIGEAIETHSGCCYLDDIYAFVKHNWQTMSDNQMSDAEIERQILITLSTNPKFMEDGENPDFYMLSSRKKRKKDVYDSEGQISKNGNVNKKKKGSEESEEDDQPRRSKRRSSREGEPPMGYACRCGATDPGQGHKWKRGPTGDFICNNCYTKWTTKLCCPVCGKMYKKQSESESEGEAPAVNEQDNAWIRCDDCHRWVMTKCDNIDDGDLETFDDSNPNHLHYSCPVCRGDKVGPLGNKPDGSKRTSMVIKTRSVAAAENGGSNHKKGPNNEESESEEDANLPDGKLEHVQREIMDKIEINFDPASIDEEESRVKLHTSHEKFLDDIQTYAVQLVGLLNREKQKGQQDLDRQIKKMREEKQRIDERLELELVQDLKNFYRKQKKEYDRAKERIVKGNSPVVKDDKL